MSVPLKIQPGKPQKSSGNIKKAPPSPLHTLITIEGEALEAKDILSLKHIADGFTVSAIVSDWTLSRHKHKLIRQRLFPNG